MRIVCGLDVFLEEKYKKRVCLHTEAYSFFAFKVKGRHLPFIISNGLGFN